MTSAASASPDTVVPDPSRGDALNRYQRSLANPLRWVDPSGHDVGCPGQDAGACGGSQVIHDTPRHFSKSESLEEGLHIVSDWFFETGPEVQAFGSDHSFIVDLLFAIAGQGSDVRWGADATIARLIISISRVAGTVVCAERCQATIMMVACLLTMTLVAACLPKDSNPPTTPGQDALVGTWEAHYSGMSTAVDRLIIAEDGTFKQEYDDQHGYTFQTGWNPWSLERFPDGRVWLHLPGARYFRYKGGAGVYDPDTNQSVEPGDQLVLKVKVRAGSGELTLEHFRTHIDDVKAINEPSDFRRVSPR